MSETFQKNQKYPYSRTSCSLDADQHRCFFPLCLLLVEVNGCVMLPLVSFFYLNFFNLFFTSLRLCLGASV